MKNIYLLLFVLVVGAPALAGAVEIKIKTNNTFFAPGTIQFPEGHSCNPNQEILPNRFYLSSVGTLWVGQGELYPISLTVEIPENDYTENYSCKVDTGNLGIFLGSKDRVLKPGIEYRSICSVHCGSVIFKVAHGFNVPATVTLTGILMNPDGTQTSIQTNKSFGISYIE